MPGIIVGIGFFWSFLLVNPPGHALLNSIWGIMLALSIRSLTLAYLVLSPAFAAVHLARRRRPLGRRGLVDDDHPDHPADPAARAVRSFILMFVSILNDYDPALFLVTPGTRSWA